MAVCEPMVEAKLFFGLTDEAAFVRFLDANVTPRFPDGLTVLSGAGRWRAPDGRMTQEASRLVLIVAARGTETMVRLQAIRTAYKAAFRQQSVGLTLSTTCADF